MKTDQTEKTNFCAQCGTEISHKANVCFDCRVSQEHTPTQNHRSGQSEPFGRWVAAIAGAVASLFIGWIPFVGPIFCGSIAGYLRGQNTRESAVTGAIATSIFAAPLFFVLIPTSFTQVFENTVGFVVQLALLAVLLCYFCGLGALGGWIGAEFTNRADPTN